MYTSTPNYNAQQIENHKTALIQLYTCITHCHFATKIKKDSQQRRDSRKDNTIVDTSSNLHHSYSLITRVPANLRRLTLNLTHAQPRSHLTAALRPRRSTGRRIGYQGVMS